jgi:hypothetical protein
MFRPSTTGAFTEGIWTGQLTLSKNDLKATISTSGDGKSGTSNRFGVGDTAQTFDHFTFEGMDTPVMPGKPFNISIRACDQYGYAYHNYTGTNTLKVAVGTITPFKTTAFVDGLWSGIATIEADTGELNWIYTYGGLKMGESGNFIMNPDHEPLD